MFKFASQKIIFFCLAFFAGVCGFAQGSSPFKDYYNHIGTIDFFVDEQYLLATSINTGWTVGEILPVISQNSKLGVIGFVEVVSVRRIRSEKTELRLKMVRQSRKYLIQKGDFIKHLNLTSKNSDYIGTTDLVIKNTKVPISSKYRPLVYQGVFIGETAQSLYQGEILFNYFGNTHIGVFDNFSMGSLLPANILGAPNVSTKWRFFDSDSNTLSAGLTYADVEEKDQTQKDAAGNVPLVRTKTVNLNLYWDSTSSDALISHIFISIGIARLKEDEQIAAIKTLGTTTFQSGYEVIMDDWNRLLVGPSYNFDKKILGGYISYLWLWDRVHLQASLETADITSLKISPKDGYYGSLEVYWRY